jgi:hypothetical protein
LNPAAPLELKQIFHVNLSNASYSLRMYLKPIDPAGQNIILANENRDVAERLVLADVVVNAVDLIFADGFE